MRRVQLYFYTRVLYCASWILPEEERVEWLREWAAELWHIVRLHDHRTVSAFVGGGCQDAYFLSADLRREGARRSYRLGSSPRLCLLFLLLAGVASLGLAFLLPGAR